MKKALYSVIRSPFSVLRSLSVNGQRLTFLMVICLILLMALLTGFTWEGELDPDEFDNWKIVKISPTPRGFIWVFIRNPDQESPIKIVAQIATPDFTLIGYRYLKDGEPYVYGFDPEQDKYVRIELSEEKRRRCMECHESRRIGI